MVKPSLALLIDGDQVPAGGIAGLLERLGGQWTVDERICVRNWRSTKDMQAWRDVAAEHGIRLIQRDPARVGKNASDIELAVITIDLLHHGRRAFCLVSGDTDFTPVIERLRRASAHIEVVSPSELSGGARGRRISRPSAATASPADRRSGTRARPPSRPARGGRPAAPAAPTAPAPGTSQEQQVFAKHIRRAIDQLKKDGHHQRGWVSVNRLGSALGAAGIRREDHGFAKSRSMNQILADLGFKVEQTETGAYQVTLAT